MKKSSSREDASKLLFAAAKKFANPQLAAIAQAVRLDAFTKVKAAIDEMVEALLTEKEDEIKHRDYCTTGLNQNDRAQELKDRDIEELEAQVADMTATIEELTRSLAQLQAEIAEMQTQIKRAGEDREIQNKDFETTVGTSARRSSC